LSDVTVHQEIHRLHLIGHHPHHHRYALHCHHSHVYFTLSCPCHIYTDAI